VYVGERSSLTNNRMIYYLDLSLAVLGILKHCVHLKKF